jgi:hypothetical protein
MVIAVNQMEKLSGRQLSIAQELELLEMARFETLLSSNPLEAIAWWNNCSVDKLITQSCKNFIPLEASAAEFAELTLENFAGKIVERMVHDSSLNLNQDRIGEMIRQVTNYNGVATWFAAKQANITESLKQLELFNEKQRCKEKKLRDQLPVNPSEAFKQLLEVDVDTFVANYISSRVDYCGDIGENCKEVANMTIQEIAAEMVDDLIFPRLLPDDDGLVAMVKNALAAVIASRLNKGCDEVIGSPEYVDAIARDHHF